MTVSIRKVLAALPSGDQGMDLTWGEVGRYIAENCNRTEDKDREKRHRIRDEFYTDGGVTYMKTVIDEVFVDPVVRDLRKKWVPHARFNNPIKRIVNEISTVYAEPARRSIGEESQVYTDLLEQLQFDIVMQQVNRLFNLHRVVLSAPRVRKMVDGTREPVIDIATPATFRVVLHPNDNKRPVGWIIRTDLKNVRRPDGQRQPAWVLWTDHERIHLDEAFIPIEATLVEHGLGMCPWVPVMRSPVQAGFWPGEEGEDLVAGHIAIWFSNVLLLKEEKSATKQTVVSGDGANTARAQANDSELVGEISDGQAMNTVDMSMDLSMFTGTSDHILERLANDYGMSLAQLKHQGVQSADAREAMRIPLRELRREQHPIFRLFERGLAKRMERVFAADADESMRFEVKKFRIDFGEAQTPMTPTEELILFEKERAAGLDNTKAFYQRRNPDADDEMAEAAIVENIDVETWRVTQMRQLMAVSGAMGTPQNGSVIQEPNDQSNEGDADLNGRDGRRRPQRSNEASPAPTGG